MSLVIHGTLLQDMGNELKMKLPEHLYFERVVFVLHGCNWRGCKSVECGKTACHGAEHVIDGDWKVASYRPDAGAYLQALAMAGAPEDMLMEWAHHLEMIPDDRQRVMRMKPWVCVQLDYYYNEAENYAEVLADRLSPHVRDEVLAIYESMQPEQRHMYHSLIIKLVTSRIQVDAPDCNLKVSRTTML
jgi:hypothetical protein